MPEGIMVIEWDRMQGGLLTHKYPPDLDFDLNSIQKIQITHQLNEGSSWIAIEEANFKVVSYYNADLERALVLLLRRQENANDLAPVVVQLAENLLPLHETVPAPEFDAMLEQQYEVIVTMVTYTEQVFEKYTGEISSLEEEIEDFKHATSIIQGQATDGKMKLLLHILESGACTIDDLEKWCTETRSCEPAALRDLLDALVDESVLRITTDDRRYAINLDYSPIKQSPAPLPRAAPGKKRRNR